MTRPSKLEYLAEQHDECLWKLAEQYNVTEVDLRNNKYHVLYMVGLLAERYGFTFEALKAFVYEPELLAQQDPILFALYENWKALC